MTVTPEDSCVWPVDPACLVDDWDALDPAIQDRALLLASATLRRLTGYRVGGCPIVVRPCKADCAGSFPSYAMTYGSPGFVRSFSPMNYGGVWINSCGCSTDCSCTVLCEVELPAPVGEVYSVMLDGVAVSPNDYRVDGNRVVWTGTGDCPWPACQDLTAAVGDAGAFAVTYLNAYPVDALGAYAAGILAMEFAQACAGNKCRLPMAVTSVARQGVSFDITTGGFPGGMTGIREVDAYIAIWNPDGRRQQTQVWSPDLTPPRVMR
jgi:hypothetical protein